MISPTSDDVDIFDSHCFATTPSSSNASDVDEPVRNLNRDVVRNLIDGCKNLKKAVRNFNRWVKIAFKPCFNKNQRVKLDVFSKLMGAAAPIDPP